MPQVHAERNCAESYKHPIALKWANQCEAPWKSAGLFNHVLWEAAGAMEPLSEDPIRQVHPASSGKALFLFEKNEFSA